MKEQEWEQKYRLSQNKQQLIRSPAPLLFTHANLFSGGKALDLAMGEGHNSLFLASHGYEVEAVDISSAAVSHMKNFARQYTLPVYAIEADLTTYKIKENYFDLIINFYFLNRKLFPLIKKGLKKNGLLFFETYTTEQIKFGRPKNPDFLLKPNELLVSFLDFFIIFYHERIYSSEGASPRAVVSLVAQKLD